MGENLTGWPFMLFNMMKTLILLDCQTNYFGGIIQTIARRRKKVTALTLGCSFWHRCQSHSAWLQTRA